MKKLFIYLLSLCAIVSCLQEERSPDEILVPTPAQVECSDESLMLTSKVPSGSEKLVQDCGFYFSKDKSMTDVRKIEGVLASNNFTAELPERAYGTTYYICSYVTNGHGSEIRSDLRSYTLDELDDYVEFGALNMLSYDKNSSTLEITIDADIWGGVKISEIGVCYGDAPTGLDVDGPHKEGVWSRKQTKGDAGVVTISIDGLSDATQYYFRGYLKDEDYISYSDVLPFYIPAIPVVQTGAVEDITPYTAVFYGEVLDECGSPVSERGFVWNEGTVAPTIESDKVVVDGALGVMSATAEGLLPNRTYTFCAYAVNASGIAYGAPVTFTTLVTLPYLSTTAVSSITSNSASFSGTVNNDGGETVSEVGFYYSIDSAVDPETSEKVSMEYADYQRSAAEYSANMLYSMMSASAETPSMSSGVETKAASDGYSFSLDVYGLALKTRYYVKAYAVNSAGVAYGKVANFETMGEIPTVKTTGSSEITTSSALLSGEVVSENGEKVTERGFVWMEGTGTPTTESNKVKVDGTTGAFTHVLADLQPNKKYSFRAYAVNAEGAAYGDVVNFTTKVALPALSGIVISSITSTSATLSCKVANHGGETVTEVGFYYSTDESLNLETAIKVSLLYSDDSFSADIANLLVNTKYYVKSYAKNSAGTEYSEVETFTTSVSSPAVKTTGSSEITSTSALLSGMVVSDNGAAITERGFVWLQGTGVPTTDSFKLKTDGTTGEYTATLEGLEPNQMYSFRAYAINSKGTSYGDIMYFSTIVGVPVLSNVDVSDITATSALFTADVKDKGGEDVTEVGFYYSTEESVDIETAVKVKKNYIGTAFSASLSELQIFTTYYVKAYAINSAGVAYSNVVSFKTLASTPVVSTVGASEITPASAVLSGSVVTDNGAEITERGFVYLKGNEAPTTSSNKIKVEGTLGDFTASLADLEPNQKYSFRAYAINAKGTSYGDIMNFSTIVNLPTLAAMKVTDINTTSARFTCTVTNHGGETVSEVGFYYGKDEDVNAETALKISEEYTSDSFSLTAKELEIGQDYFVKAYTKNSVGESYSSVIKFKTTSTAPTVNTVGYTKLTATSAELSGDVADDNGEPITERGFVWIKGAGTPTTSSSNRPVEGTIGEYTAIITDLEPNQTYSYRAYAINSRGTSYGEVMQFEISVSLPTVTTNDVTSITNTSATTGGVITSDGGGEILAKGIVWSTTKNPTIETSNYTDEGEDVESFTSRLTELRPGFTYYVRAYATNIMGTVYGEEKQFITSGEIQSIPLEASNSFIISYSDVYSFQTVKGHSSESVGSVASAEVLWESFGTNEQPEIGSLVSFVTYKNGRISFATADIFREGNAVIAAKDASGTILWSWHIWLTDQPQEQVYYNNAGTMMDRNLGATSATPGDVGALGLLYQWGRKDPFLGSSSISSNIEAKSTITWPSSVSSNSSNGTIEYATANPTTFIAYNSNNSDWYYTGSSSTDDTRWQSDKTIYDPCPIGWRVPDGGEYGVWSNALGLSSSYSGTYDSTNEGMNFSSKLGDASTIWYPASGYRNNGGGAPTYVGDYGRYWSVTPYSNDAYYLNFNNDGDVYPSNGYDRVYGLGVRCQKEGTGGGPMYDNNFSTSGARSLSSAGTANSYIVSGAGVYSISAVKGNSLESVGSVASAEVLWESFGTDEKIFKSNLVSGVRYENGEIYFKTADSYREGNAVIAAKDATGTILWSWHIWLTDQPQELVYKNDAGTMMDRNLGAISASPGDVGALGLFYQWGRKDPFLGSSSIKEDKLAESTMQWPKAVVSSESLGTIEYSISNPTTFISKDEIYNNGDWYYTGSTSTDDTRWQAKKTIYDPCPVGWHVPEIKVWSLADFDGLLLDGLNIGISFPVDDSTTTWYPAAGYRDYNAGSLYVVVKHGYYWSVTTSGKTAYRLDFANSGYSRFLTSSRGQGYSVRCQKE